MRYKKNDTVYYFNEKKKKIWKGKVLEGESYGGYCFYTVKIKKETWKFTETQLSRTKEALYKKTKKKLEKTITTKRNELDDAIFALKGLERSYRGEN